MRTIERLKVAALTFLPLVATVATLAPIAGWTHAGTGIVVLGAAICLTTARAEHPTAHWMSALLRIPLAAVAVSLLALAFTTSLVAGDALFVAVVFFASAARAIGPRAATIGRAAMLPLLGLLIAPVRLGPHPARTFAFAVVAGAVAGVWTLLVAALARRAGRSHGWDEPANPWPGHRLGGHPGPWPNHGQGERPGTWPSHRPGDRSRTWSSRRPDERPSTWPSHRLDEGSSAWPADAMTSPSDPSRPGAASRTSPPPSDAIRNLTGAPQADATGANHARQADPTGANRPPQADPTGANHARQADPTGANRPPQADPTSTDRALRAAPTGRLSGAAGADATGRAPAGGTSGAGGAAPAEATAARVHVWRGARSAISLALAFALGQALFPEHWTWTVVSAFAIGVGARSRGDAVLKGVQRIAGVCAGTLGATLLSQLVDGRPLVAVMLILTFLGLGLFLREFNYVWWAMAITAVLALLFGLAGQTGGAELLRQRVLAGLLGGACAVVPAVFLAPIRTRALVLKRAATALRAVRGALDAAPRSATQSAAVRRAERDIEELRDAARPLLAIRRVHRRAELDWVDALTGALPDLRALPTDGGAAVRARLASTTKNTAQSVRAAAANRA